MTNELAIRRDNIDHAMIGLSPVRGSPLKVDNGVWYRGYERELFPVDQDLLVVDMTEAWQFLKKGCAVEYAPRDPEAKVRPPRPASFADKASWPTYNNEPSDPWRYVAIIHLLSLLNGETLHFASSTAGAWMAHDELLVQIKSMRQLQPGSLPIVRAAATSFKTQYGPRQGPMFRIVGWRRPKLEVGELKQIEPATKTERATAETERVNPFNDELPW